MKRHGFCSGDGAHFVLRGDHGHVPDQIDARLRRFPVMAVTTATLHPPAGGARVALSILTPMPEGWSIATSNFGLRIPHSVEHAGVPTSATTHNARGGSPQRSALRGLRTVLPEPVPESAGARHASGGFGVTGTKTGASANGLRSIAERITAKCSNSGTRTANTGCTEHHGFLRIAGCRERWNRLLRKPSETVQGPIGVSRRTPRLPCHARIFHRPPDGSDRRTSPGSNSHRTRNRNCRPSAGYLSRSCRLSVRRRRCP